MRTLHLGLRVAELERSIAFYTGVLGMHVLRTTDRPDQQYTLAFVGYADESQQAVLELTYNYGVDRYDLGSAYGHVAIAVPDCAAACAAVRQKGGTVTAVAVRSISGIAAVISAWAVETLKRKASSNASAVVSRNGRGMAPPTLLTTTSRRPNAPRAAPLSRAA